MKTIMVYQCEIDKEIEMELYGLLRYIGESGVLTLTDGNVYACVGIDSGALRIVDDDDEDYLYDAETPLENGRWEIVEIYNDELKKFLELYGNNHA